MLFTSGSEGKPKGVVAVASRDPGQHRANTCCNRFLAFRQDSSVTLPIFHAFGFTCGGIMPHRHWIEDIPLSLSPSLPHHPRGHLRPGTVPCCSAPAHFSETMPALRIRTISTGCATSWPAQKNVNEEVRKHLDRKIRHPHPGGLRRHGMCASAGGEYAYGLPHRNSGTAAAWIGLQTGSPCQASARVDCSAYAAQT